MTPWFWQKALDHPTLIPIILSCGAFHRCASLKASGAAPHVVHRSRQDALRLRADAIKSIQKLLEDASTVYSESAVVAIARLLCLEGAEANTSAVETHGVGLRIIVDSLGGSDNFESQTNTIIYSCDFLKGYIMNSPPTFSVADRWEQDVQSQIAVDPNRVRARSALGSHFVTSPWSGALHSSLRSSLRLCRQLALYFESTFYAQPKLSSAGLVIENSLLILSRRLLSLSGDPLLDPFQDTLRQSILVYCGLRFWKFQGMPFMVVHFERFQRTLVSSLSLIQEDSRLCFWVLFVGGLASQTFKCHSWFLFQLRETAEQLSLRDWDHARSLLEGFFFVSYPKDDPAEVFWESVLQN
ncbi:uncharacterized protein N7459_003626 [Penicillium hispanicum]|uniref:uncharacterized protein n=1 Tax=Penicillium hispanicum TaxID=1080232 RepID=UPI0025424F5F|nr:uncharacterized protein N7459_003626 [Penicillium hispanicum]KAJ5587861.1 hypothetical protein N7459_003626 [Penicillium hispanicum]